MTSKELFFMNGGISSYIYRDGFGDQYKATPAEEREWTRELIALKWQQLDTETNTTNLQHIIDTLAYHHADNLVPELIKKLETVSPKQKVVIAGKLWKISKYKESFSVIHDALNSDRKTLIDDAFWVFNEMTENKPLRIFLVSCLDGDDTVLQKKAHTTLTMWAYSGLPKLREGTLLEDVKPTMKTDNPERFQKGLSRVKRILAIRA